jgi:hypothetical protein
LWAFLFARNWAVLRPVRDAPASGSKQQLCTTPLSSVAGDVTFEGEDHDDGRINEPSRRLRGLGALAVDAGVGCCSRHQRHRLGH